VISFPRRTDANKQSVVRNALPKWQRETIAALNGVSLHYVLANLLLLSTLAIVFVPNIGLFEPAVYLLIVSLSWFSWRLKYSLVRDRFLPTRSLLYFLIPGCFGALVLLYQLLSVLTHLTKCILSRHLLFGTMETSGIGIRVVDFMTLCMITPVLCYYIESTLGFLKRSMRLAVCWKTSGMQWLRQILRAVPTPWNILKGGIRLFGRWTAYGIEKFRARVAPDTRTHIA
jgi:hypothetical protein